MTESVARPYLSLVIPAYNEARRIESSLAAAWAYLTDQGYAFELILVDDGSNDETLALASAFAASHDHVVVVAARHAGKASAIRRGMRRARGEHVAFTDADLATPIAYLEPFLARIAGGADIVVGSREGAGAHRVGEPLYRHLMGRVFNRIVQLLLLRGINDTQCGFKLFRGSIVPTLLERARLYADDRAVVGARVTAFDVELLVIARRLGMRIEEIPVVWTYGSHSKVNPVRDTLNNLRDVGAIALALARGQYD